MASKDAVLALTRVLSHMEQPRLSSANSHMGCWEHSSVFSCSSNKVQGEKSLDEVWTSQVIGHFVQIDPWAEQLS